MARIVGHHTTVQCATLDHMLENKNNKNIMNPGKTFLSSGGQLY